MLDVISPRFRNDPLAKMKRSLLNGIKNNRRDTWNPCYVYMLNSFEWSRDNIGRFIPH